MRVLMLGWSFSAKVSGGVGVACLGLTRGLIRRGADVLFLMPERPQQPSFDELTLIHSHGHDAKSDARLLAIQQALLDPREALTHDRQTRRARGIATFKSLPSYLDSPYLHRGHDVPRQLLETSSHSNRPQAARESGLTTSRSLTEPAMNFAQSRSATPPPHYSYGDTDLLYRQAMQYSQLCVEAARTYDFDVIHAHDWLTFPAAMAIAADSGKPLVVQLHSTETDRAGPGDAGEGQIREFERRAIQAADRVIVASGHLASIIEKEYGDHHDKTHIIHHGASLSDTGVQPPASQPRGDAAGLFMKLDRDFADHAVVVFAGRITMQKGARFFVEAASKVLAQRSNTVFVMAGSGDQMPLIMEQAAREGIADDVVLPGYLTPHELSRLFQRASVFVMPSVSEPFGLAALEAMHADVPVIVSNTSGVAEVVEHVLKVDFWDTDQIAAKICAVLDHPDLAATLRQHAVTELKKLTWDAAAERCLEVYQSMSG